MINVGVIGCGYWGPNLIRNFVACPETNLICACDLEEKRLWTTCGYGPYSSHCREARSVHLPAWNEARRNKAKNYLDLLKEVDGVILPKTNKHCLHVYYLFVIQVDNRDDVVEALKQMGISTGLHYPIPLHLQKAYGHMGLAVGLSVYIRWLKPAPRGYSLCRCIRS